VDESTVTDTDGNVYRCVTIGNQWWMAEDMIVTRYRNGDPIPNIKDKSQWADLTAGAYCSFENSEDYVSSYGRLYNAYVVEDSRGICPDGWHIPSDEEWIQLELFLGMSESEANRMTASRGTNEGEKLKAASFGGTDEVGFAAKGTGYRHPNGEFRALDIDTDYWTSTTYDNNGSLESVLHGLVNTRSNIDRNYHDQKYGFCLRCIKSQ
jgi:uncharacterized protein (TIGR02145 family)